MMYLFNFHNAVFRFKYAQRLFEKDRNVLEYMSQYEDRKIYFFETAVLFERTKYMRYVSYRHACINFLLI